MSTACRVCSGATTTELASFQNWLSYIRGSSDARAKMARIIDDNPQFHLRGFFRCDACGFISVSPLPRAEDLGVFYSAYYGSSGYIDKSRKKLSRAKNRLRQIRRYAKGGRFLDIGCNVGYVVEAARKAGFAATGIEIDAQAIKTAQDNFPGSEFVCADAASFAKNSSPFDFIYCSEVIEHVPDLRAFAATLAALCKKGSYMYVTTPDATRRKSPQSFIEWEEVKPPEHLHWFTRKSLGTLLEDAGFRVEKFVFNFKPGLKLFVQRL